MRRKQCPVSSSRWHQAWNSDQGWKAIQCEQTFALFICRIAVEQLKSSRAEAKQREQFLRLISVTITKLYMLQGHTISSVSLTIQIWLLVAKCVIITSWIIEFQNHFNGYYCNYEYFTIMSIKVEEESIQLFLFVLVCRIKHTWVTRVTSHVHRSEKIEAHIELNINLV